MTTGERAGLSHLTHELLWIRDVSEWLHSMLVRDACSELACLGLNPGSATDLWGGSWCLGFPVYTMLRSR